MDTRAAPDLSKELQQRTADLERHIKEIRQQQEPREPRPRQNSLAAIANAQRAEERQRAVRMERMMCAMYPLSHANQFHSSYVYFNTGFAMKVMHPRNRSTESVSEAICARERAGRDGESASEETKEGPDTARRAPMRHTVERTETIDDKSETCRREN